MVALVDKVTLLNNHKDREYIVMLRVTEKEMGESFQEIRDRIYLSTGIKEEEIIGNVEISLQEKGIF